MHSLKIGDTFCDSDHIGNISIANKSLDLVLKKCHQRRNIWQILAQKMIGCKLNDAWSGCFTLVDG